MIWTSKPEDNYRCVRAFTEICQNETENKLGGQMIKIKFPHLGGKIVSIVYILYIVSIPYARNMHGKEVYEYLKKDQVRIQKGGR